MPTLTIKTSTLQNMMSKAVKGASNNKFNVLTSLMNVVLENGTLKLTTTDTDNYLTVKQSGVAGDNMSFTVNVETFSKLVFKTSVEDIKITATDDNISVTGNGTYKIPIQLDVDGSPINYPDHVINNPDITGSVKTAVIKTIVQYNKPSLSITMEKPYLTKYMCVEDCVISGDEYNVCRNTVETFNTELLISPIVMDLLCMCEEENIKYSIYENNVLFETDTMKLFASVPNEGIDEYPVDKIKMICDSTYTSDCVLPKTSLINVIDRLSLFINDDDQNGLYMTFTTNGVKIESMKNDAIETIAYQGSNNFKDYTCCVGVDSLRKQLVARSGESVHIYYGDPSTLTIKEGNITQVLSLLNDPRFDDEEGDE